MLRKFKKGKASTTALTWEEKYPTDYRYYSSGAIKRLRKIVEKNEKVAQSAKHKNRKKTKKNIQGSNFV